MELSDLKYFNLNIDRKLHFCEEERKIKRLLIYTTLSAYDWLIYVKSSTDTIQYTYIWMLKEALRCDYQCVARQ